MHEQGLGTRQDVEEAFKWYAKAAEQGDPWAKRKLANRKEIMEELKQQQETENPDNTEPTATPENSANPEKSTASSKPAAVARTDQARKQERDRIKAAEREKRRAMVRAMVLERMRNPVGGMFE